MPDSVHGLCGYESVDLGDICWSNAQPVDVSAGPVCPNAGRQRPPEDKFRSPSRAVAVRGYGAAMHFDEPLGHRQPDAKAARVRARAHEQIEQTAQRLRCNACPCIRHANHTFATLSFHDHRNRAALRCVSDRVRQNVAYDLAEPRYVRIDLEWV